MIGMSGVQGSAMRMWSIMATVAWYAVAWPSHAQQSRKSVAVHASERPAGWVGVSVVISTDDNSTLKAYPIILSVDPESPAQRAGLVAGDTILSYDGLDARSVMLQQLLVPNKRITFKCRRNGERDVHVVVGKRKSVDELMSVTIVQEGDSASMPNAVLPSTMISIFSVPDQSSDRVSSSPVSFAGAILIQMSTGLAKGMGVQNSGILALSTLHGTPAERAGLQSGDIITEIDGSPASTVKALLRAIDLKKRSGDHTMKFSILRDGKVKQLALRL
jgi:S1-C subfamily serine protease